MHAFVAHTMLYAMQAALALCDGAAKQIETYVLFFLSFSAEEIKKLKQFLIWFSSFCIFSCSEWFCFLPKKKNGSVFLLVFTRFDDGVKKFGGQNSRGEQCKDQAGASSYFDES